MFCVCFCFSFVLFFSQCSFSLQFSLRTVGSHSGANKGEDEVLSAFFMKQNVVLIVMAFGLRSFLERCFQVSEVVQVKHSSLKTLHLIELVYFAYQVLRKPVLDPRLLRGSSDPSRSVHATVWISRQYRHRPLDPIFPAIHGLVSILLPVSVRVLDTALSVRYQDACKRGHDLHEREVGKGGNSPTPSHRGFVLYGWNAGL